MTAFNRQKYIAMAIESVLASSYGNFELIIVDDGSSDDTVNIARRYAAKDPRVKVYINEKNLGDYPNRNQAASYASGKYIKYVDADDYIYPDGLERLVLTMEQFPNAGWGLCSLEQYIEKPFPFQLMGKEIYHYHYLGPGLFHKAPLSSIIRKDAFDAVGGFMPIRMCGDFEMWHRMALHYPVVLMPHGIVWYREHGEQEVKSYMLYLQDYERISKKYLDHDQCPLTKEEITMIRNKSRRQLLKQLLLGILTFNQVMIKSSWLKLSA